MCRNRAESVRVCSSTFIEAEYTGVGPWSWRDPNNPPPGSGFVELFVAPVRQCFCCCNKDDEYGRLHPRCARRGCSTGAQRVLELWSKSICSPAARACEEPLHHCNEAVGQTASSFQGHPQTADGELKEATKTFWLFVENTVMHHMWKKNKKCTTCTPLTESYLFLFTRICRSKVSRWLLRHISRSYMQ